MNSTSSYIAGHHYAKSSQVPITEIVRHGMVAMGITGLISTISTFTLLVFMMYRMIFWRRYYEESMAKNQVLLLLFNLLIADFQQSLAFTISFYWLWHNEIVGPHPVCSAQGWFVQIGDVSSGCWVLAIGIHTFINIVLRKSIPMSAFSAAAITIWAFCIMISAVGPIKYKDIFVPTAAWCWIDSQYKWERLYLHYAYIFLAEVSSIIVYTFIIFYLHGQIAIHSKNHQASSGTASGAMTTGSSNHNPFAASQARILKTARYMILYPAAYVTLTLPLAAARVYSMTFNKPPSYVFILAGTMIGSSGWIDVLLYLTTRKVLISTKSGGKSGPSPWHKFHTRLAGRGEEDRVKS